MRTINQIISRAVLALLIACSVCSAKIIYVDDDANGVNEGSSWVDAYVYLQDALADANESEKPVEIRVAQGIYKPDQGANQTLGDREATFQLINGVTLKGGYAGAGTPDPNARVVALYKTILSGDLNCDDVEVLRPHDLLYEPNRWEVWHPRDLLYDPNRAENSYHVVTASGTDNTAILDGFTITAGNANVETYPDHRSIGGGMYNETGSATLSNCTFINNAAYSGGAGVFNFDNSNPTMTHCDFIMNYTVEDGAGIINVTLSCPVLTSCNFIGNLAEDHAGGMLNADKSNPVLTNCSFMGNLAGAGFLRYDGGGMLNDDSSPTLTNCIFIYNTAGRNGGGIYNKNNSDAILTNCTFSKNNANSSGGGIHNENSTSILTNCIVWFNEPEQIYGDAEVTYSDIQGGWEGVGNIDADPLFADPNNGDYHLKSQVGQWDPNSRSWVKDDVTSPCIDAGDPNSDWTGETWPHGGRINMGAYGGTRQASMSTETGGMSLPRVLYIYNNDMTATDSFESLLEMYGVSVTFVFVNNLEQVSLNDYALVIVGSDTAGAQAFDDGQFVAAVEDSGKPVVGLGYGGYDFFGELGLSIGNPYGGHGSCNSIQVIDPEYSLFSTPYPVDVPGDGVLQLYTETDSVGIYLWPEIPETVAVIGLEANNVGYYPLAMEHNRYLFWGFTESPQKMTEIGKRLFINVVIWTANAGWES